MVYKQGDTQVTLCPLFKVILFKKLPKFHKSNRQKFDSKTYRLFIMTCIGCYKIEDYSYSTIIFTKVL